MKWTSVIVLVFLTSISSLAASNLLITTENLEEEGQSLFRYSYKGGNPHQQGIEPINTNIINTQKASLDNLILELDRIHQKLEIIDESDKNTDFAVWTGILLACVTIIITVLGVVIAIISFFGFRHVKESSKTAAILAASDVAKSEANNRINEVAKAEISRLINNGELQEQLESAVDLIVRSGDKYSGSSGFNQYPEIDIEEDY